MEGARRTRSRRHNRTKTTTPKRKKKISNEESTLSLGQGSSTFPPYHDGDDKHFFLVFHSDNVLCLSHNAGRDQVEGSVKKKRTSWKKKKSF